MNKYNDMLYSIASLIAKECIESKEDPFEVRDSMIAAVKQAVNDYVSTKYHKIVFDSPMGEDSAHLLNEAGFFARWEGNPGNRGETIWYLPKTDELPRISDPKMLIDCLEMVNDINPDNKLNGLFDKYTSIEVM